MFLLKGIHYAVESRTQLISMGNRKENNKSRRLKKWDTELQLHTKKSVSETVEKVTSQKCLGDKTRKLAFVRIHTFSYNCGRVNYNTFNDSLSVPKEMRGYAALQ